MTIFCYPPEYNVAAMRLLLHWIVSALSLLLVAYIVPGIHVDGFGAALIAAALIGIINATLGLFLKVISLPIIVITFGLFWFVINALVLELASGLLSGFHVANFGAAFVGAIVLSLVSWILQWLVRPRAVTTY
jgi:putative membrane protein